MCVHGHHRVDARRFLARVSEHLLNESCRECPAPSSPADRIALGPETDPRLASVNAERRQAGCFVPPVSQLPGHTK
jgi:hypothetical protein